MLDIGELNTLRSDYWRKGRNQ